MLVMVCEHAIVTLRENNFPLIQSNIDAASLEWGFYVPTEVSNQSYIAVHLLKGCMDGPNQDCKGRTILRWQSPVSEGFLYQRR